MLKEYPLNRVFTLIEPGPALLVTTANGRKKNIMTITWSMAMSFNPMFGIVTGPWNHSFDTIMKTQQCVVAIPGVDLIDKVIGIGTCSGTDTDKFKKFSLTAKKAKEVKAPLIEECLFNMECKVADYINEHGIIILECIRAWENSGRAERRTFHAIGDGTFVADGEKQRSFYGISLNAEYKIAEVLPDWKLLLKLNKLKFNNQSGSNIMKPIDFAPLQTEAKLAISRMLDDEDFKPHQPIFVLEGILLP